MHIIKAVDLAGSDGKWRRCCGPCGSYADVGIRFIMPRSGLCRPARQTGLGGADCCEECGIILIDDLMVGAGSSFLPGKGSFSCRLNALEFGFPARLRDFLKAMGRS